MKATGLLIYGERALTPAASKNLVTAAVFLVILWLFDAAAWTLLLNMVLTGELYQFALATLPALIGGILAATGILFYESSFITADMRHAAHPGIAVTIRVSVVLLFALITSVPMDMHLLDSQINRRIHEEQVLLQLPEVVREWDDARDRMNGNAVTRAQVDAGTVKPRAELDDATASHQTAQQEYEKAVATERAQAGHVRKLESYGAQDDLDDQTLAQINRELPSAKAELVKAQRTEAEKLAALQAATSKQSEARVNVLQKQSDVQVETTKQASQDATRYENWIHDLWAARPMTTVQERRPPDGNALTYDGAAQEGNLGFGERVIAMYDVLAGRPPRRPSMSSGDMASLQQMNLSAFVKGDQESEERAQTDAASLRWGSITFAVLFTLFPLLILALKMLFDPDTKRYFDSEYQRTLSQPPDDMGAPLDASLSPIHR